MKQISTHFMIAILSFCFMSSDGICQKADKSGDRAHQTGIEPGIVWYGSLEDGLAVAKETERPIFLLSAAPQCTGVPGVW